MNSEILDMPPPHSLEAERAVIGCVLLKPALFDGMNLEAVDFHAEEHRRIWRVFTELAQQGVGIDHLVVMDRLRAEDSANNKRIGPHQARDVRELSCTHSSTLAEAAQAVPVWAHWKYYRDIVLRTRAKRTAIHFLIELLHGAYDDSIEPEQWVATLLTRAERMRDWLNQKRRP